MSQHNSLSVSIYEPFSTTALVDEDNPEQMGLSWFETLYPGGLYGGGVLRLESRILKTWGVMKVYPYRVVGRNGLKPVYEGWVDVHERAVDPGGQYIELPLVGAFGKVAQRRGIRRLFADNRLGADVWIDETGANAAEKCQVDRRNRIRITPKGVAWVANDVAIIRYTAPTGEYIKRVEYDYDLQEGAQSWELIVRDVTNGTTINTYSSSGSGTGASAVMGASCAVVDIRFTSLANQTPASDGTIYGELSNIKVYCVTANSGNYARYGHEILIDALSEFSDEINSGTNFIDQTNTLNITPFITQGGGFEYLAAYMSRAAGFGDASNDPWAWGFRHSESVALPDGKPPAYYEQQPALTDFDYQLQLGEPNLAGSVRVIRPFDAVVNRVWVNYTDELGANQWQMYTDDATLQAADSQSRYMIQESVVKLGQASSTAAIAFAKRVLAKNKYSSSLLQVGGAIPVKGYLRNQYGLRVPASEVTAGKRIKLVNFLDGFNDAATNAVTMLISRTRYDTREEKLNLTVGKPDSLHTFWPFTT